MHIVLFGGAFDPPHLGHVTVVKNFLKLGIADRLVFLPVHNHAFEKNMLDYTHRLEMLEKVKEKHFKDFPVYTSDFELTKPGKTFTFETLSELSQSNPHNQYSFLIGSDNLASFHKWNQYQELLDNYKIFIYPRAGFSFEHIMDGMIPLPDMPEMEVSSTLVREHLENKTSVNDLLSEEVLEYIHENGLY